MLEQEIAALVHFIRELKLVTQEYFGEVPEGAATPSVYYPVPDIEGNEFSLSTYENSFSLFIKIFDKDTLGSYAIASRIVDEVQSAGKKIPLYDENGNLTGRCFRVEKLGAKNIDTGTTQIELTWNVRRGYSMPAGTKGNIYFEGLPTKVEVEVEEEESENG